MTTNPSAEERKHLAKGEGHPVILVGGALRSPVATRSLAERLASQFSAISYDRRSRGDSGDTAPYAVEREIEDLAALITAAEGRRRFTATRPARASLCARRCTICP